MKDVGEVNQLVGIQVKQMAIQFRCAHTDGAIECDDQPVDAEMVRPHRYRDPILSEVCGVASVMRPTGMRRPYRYTHVVKEAVKTPFKFRSVSK